MNAQEAWKQLQDSESLQVPLHRWTQDGATGEEFTYQIRPGTKGQGIRFLRDGEEVKSASFERFAQFFSTWQNGSRSPEEFRNEGEKGTKAAVAHFLLPLFERVVSLSAHSPGIVSSASSKDVRQLMSKLQRPHIEAALRALNTGAVGLFAESSKYDLVVNGTAYPPKRVVGLALEELTGDRFGPHHFKGGELSSCFRTLKALGYEIHDKRGQPLSVRTPRQTGQKYQKPSWQMALDAVHALGGEATVRQVSDWIVSRVPEYDTGNVEPDLNMLAVNSNSRGGYEQNTKARQTDGFDPYDALYVERHQEENVYVLYDPEKHGIWELAKVEGAKRLRPRLLGEEEVQSTLEAARFQAEKEGDFDPRDETDARKKSLAAIVRRQGQGRFRQVLLKAYNRRCAITGCDLVDALEAAHIRGYMGSHTNRVTNGLLLRADVHTLFDLGLIRVDPQTLTVVVASRLLNTHYGAFSGLKIALPLDKSKWPSKEALQLHGAESLAY